MLRRSCPLIGLLLLVLASGSGRLVRAAEYDAANGKAIMEMCAGCHGDFGQGGGGGEYPRLAGLSAKYLATQLRKFKSGERQSMAMAPYAEERELPEADLLDISQHLSEIELLTQMPAIDPGLDSYQKLLIASKVFNVAKLEGDTVRGQAIYERDCRKCHGPGARGNGAFPPLTGQFSDYIRLQIAEFQSGRRVNKPMLKSITALSAEEVDALLAYLSIADD
jgi:cytochrome c553